MPHINPIKLLPTELPKPHLGDLSDLKALSAQVRREKNPNVLNYTYKDLVTLDNVTISLVPEKKGLLLKHVEYEIKSEVCLVESERQSVCAILGQIFS